MGFAAWALHFARNQDQFSWIDRAHDAPLSPDDRVRITQSIQQFQHGENSEGRHLMDRAPELRDSGYVESIRLFIREEQSHARALAAFMDAQGIPRITKHWVDTIFRRLRAFGGLETSVRVLITAEIIAAVYYQALHDATPSPFLRSICTQILEDEEHHIAFQSEALRRCVMKRHPIPRFFISWIHRVLLSGTVTIVWLGHRSVLTAGLYNYATFFATVWQVWRRANGMITGRLPVVVQTMRRMRMAA